MRTLSIPTRAEANYRLPARLIRVVAAVGYGYPECTRRELTQRTFADPRAAARWIANLAAWPRHHRLVAIYETATDWSPLDPSELPDPEDDTHDDDD